MRCIVPAGVRGTSPSRPIVPRQCGIEPGSAITNCRFKWVLSLVQVLTSVEGPEVTTWSIFYRHK